VYSVAGQFKLEGTAIFRKRRSPWEQSMLPGCRSGYARPAVRWLVCERGL